MIEAASARARDVCIDSVEDFAILFVGVESLIEKVSQEPSGLRNAEAIRTPDAQRSVIGVLQIRNCVPHGCQSKANDRRVLGAIDHFIYLARLEAAVEINVSRIRNRLSVNHPGKPPLTARDRLARAKHRVPNRQLACIAVGVCGSLSILSAVTKRGVENSFGKDEV